MALCLCWCGILPGYASELTDSLGAETFLADSNLIVYNSLPFSLGLSWRVLTISPFCAGRDVHPLTCEQWAHALWMGRTCLGIWIALLEITVLCEEQHAVSLET